MSGVEKSENQTVRPLRTKRIVWVVAVCWLVMVALPSIHVVRGWMILPLYRHDADARGDVAYVMADGYAYMERLRGAADLYHMGRIKEIYILNERESQGYNFALRRSQSKSERATDYLSFQDVPRSIVHVVDAKQGIVWMGSLFEAQAFAAAIPPDVDSVVVVTSAPHTRRSLLSFERSLPESVRASVFSPSDPEDSAELTEPIWQEYCKMLIYLLVA